MCELIKRFTSVSCFVGIRKSTASPKRSAAYDSSSGRESITKGPTVLFWNKDSSLTCKMRPWMRASCESETQKSSQMKMYLGKRKRQATVQRELG